MNEILSMHVENFLGFKSADFDFEKTGFVLVEGMNGAGKSAMIDAIVWCLFGKTLRGYEHDDVVNRKVGEGCIVTVRLRDRDSEWGVSRARRHKRLKNSLTIDDAFGSGFVHPTGDDTQAEIERRLGCTYKTFMSSVVFGQDRAYRFSSLTDAEQKKILDEVLGVERFAAACAVARKNVTSVQVDLDTLRRDAARVAEARDDAERDAVGLKAKSLDFHKAQQAKVDAEREKVRKAKDWLGKTRKVADVNGLKEALDAATFAVTKYERKLDKAVAANAAAAVRLATTERSIATACRDIESHESRSDTCPTCGQKVDAKKHAKAMVELRAELDELHATRDQQAFDATTASTAFEIARSKVKDAKVIVERAQKAYNDGIVLAGDAASWRKRLTEYEARVMELEREADPYAELAVKAKSKALRHAKEVETIETKVMELEAELRRAQFWVKAFGNSGLRSLMVDTSLPLLNEEAARVSRALTGGAIAVEFSATSEQKSGKVVDRFEVRVDNRDGAGDYKGNSSGERAKVDLCVGLALQRLVASRSRASFNLAVYDEVFDHLDSSSHEQVIDVLSSLDVESVLVISHDDDLKAWFPATWRIAKRGGYSTVEV